MVQQQTIIVMHNSVLRAYAALPKNVRKQFENFLEKFQENPKAPGIHLERLTTRLTTNSIRFVSTRNTVA